jgi:hypothetical protein
VDPDVIVFGGGLSNISELYGQLPCRIAPPRFSDEMVGRAGTGTLG